MEDNTQDDPGWKTVQPLFEKTANEDSGLSRAQKLIHDAIEAIETGPADDHLTDVVELLNQARDKIAKFIRLVHVEPRDDVPEAGQEAEEA